MGDAVAWPWRKVIYAIRNPSPNRNAIWVTLYMKKYYKERFLALRQLDEKITPLMEINDILGKMRDDLREVIPNAMEARILLLDPDAKKYTRPLQCILFDKPVNCLTV